MDLINIMKWLGAVTAVMGQGLINRKNIMAYPVWIFSSIMMIIATFITKDWAFFSLYTVYLVLNVDGLRHWSIKQKEEDSNE